MPSPPQQRPAEQRSQQIAARFAAPRLTEAELEAEVEAEAAEVQRLVGRDLTSAPLVRSAVERMRWRRRRSSEELPSDPELWRTR